MSSYSRENNDSEAASHDSTGVVDAVQLHGNWDNSKDVHAVIQELRAEIKALHARVDEFSGNKSDPSRATAAIQESTRRITPSSDTTPEIQEASVTQSKDVSDPYPSRPAAKVEQSRIGSLLVSRVRYRTSKLKDSGTRVESDGKPPSPQNITNSDADIAFEAKAIFNKDDKISSHEITLKSRGLRSVIWKVIGDWLRHEKVASKSSWINNDQTWASKFLFMMHYWTEFEAEATDERFKDDQHHQDLRDLLQHIEAVQPDIVKYRRKLATLEKIRHDLVWLLYRPGSLIVTKPDSEQVHHQVLQVHSHVRTREPNSDEMTVIAWAFDWNGSELVRRYFEFPLGKQPFMEESHIRDLPCWPIRYLYSENLSESNERSDLTVMRDTLVRRGQDMREHCVLKSGKDRMCNFSGLVQVWEKESEPEERFLRRFSVHDESRRTSRKITNKRIMVDFDAYREFHSMVGGFGNLKTRSLAPCTCSYCVRPQWKEWVEAFNDPKKTNEELLEKYDDESWLLLPYRLLGYAIDGEFWAQFPVAGITKYIHRDRDAYEKVLFPEDKTHQKTALRNLVLSHLSVKDEEKPDGYWVSDFIQGKGHGLVVLLHGASGLGKTSTAESLARAAQRPLLKISASGIGVTAKAAEENLMKYFRLATSWEAIILLDEADVFLETRGTPGEKVFERNALVAVMLRILEYFDGVLFLTTNRVMKLDIAMLSRIHYAIHFTELTKDQEKGIWDEQLRQLKVAKGNVVSGEKTLIESYVQSYQKRPRGPRFNQRIGLNGREIHNVFKTAQHMANGDGKRKIKKEDLEAAIEAIENFRGEMRERVEKAETQLVVRGEKPDS